MKNRIRGGDLTELDLVDLRAFFMVAETGNFSRAAHRLESSKSVVSRRVARLEEALSVQLLKRTASGTILTEAGQRYYDQAHAAIAQLHSASDSLNESLQDISGPIRVTVPVYLGAIHLAPLFCAFGQLYPRIDLEIHASDDKVDIARAGFDLAVRTGYLPDSALSCRALCQAQRVLVASPDYLSNNPAIETPEDLSVHQILHYNSLTPQELWRYHLDGKPFNLPIRPHFRSNHASILMSAVTAGLGLTVMPSYVTAPAILAGQAVQVLSHVDWGLSPVNMLTPSGRKAPLRVRLLLDFLSSQFYDRYLSPQSGCTDFIRSR